MNLQNHRLLSTRPDLKLATRVLVGLTWLLCAGIWGCRPASETTNLSQPTESTTSPSTIPLRVWIVAPMGDEQIWMRQWLAGSEQPLELRSLTVGELLQLNQCDCDVLLHPARLIGELAQRGWIVKLPDMVETDMGDTGLTNESQDGPTTVAPLAWRQQASYAGETMSVPLGCAVPVFLTSSAVQEMDRSVDWETLLLELQLAELDAPQFEVAGLNVDREALVDRFLAIAATLSNRDPSYGLLFDLQTMRSRLNDEHFERAAKILAALASQPDGLASVIEDHSVAWNWATGNQRPALAVAAPALIDAASTLVTTGRIVNIAGSDKGAAQTNHTNLAATQPNAASEANTIADQTTEKSRPRVLAWNGGGGLQASLSGQCRQSNQATALLRWLSQPTTRTVLAKFASGIEPATSTASVDSLSWQARQFLSQVVTSAGVAHEPRLPLATEYRDALAEALLEFLSGQSDAGQAMQIAATRWQAITDKAGEAQRRNYEKSLGLTL